MTLSSKTLHYCELLAIKQWLASTRYKTDSGSKPLQFDMVLPVMTMVEFLFYVGWMKVAMSLLNPFGEDDDDLECNFFIDKNLAVRFLRCLTASNASSIGNFFKRKEATHPLEGTFLRERMSCTQEKEHLNFLSSRPIKFITNQTPSMVLFNVVESRIYVTFH